MSNTVLVGCKLPSGIVLDGATRKIELNGLNTTMISGGVGLTHVDAVEWMYIQEVYKSHAAFASNAVFNYKDSDSVADVVEMAADLSEVKTGFEGLDPNAPANGIKPDDPAKLKKVLGENEGAKVPAKAVASKKDRAAAIEAATGA